MTSPRHTYVARINRVIDHIDAHLADTLDLATLAGVAHFSSWHFHRVFQAMAGETLADCVRRRRLEVAAARLLGLPPEPVLAIALDVGFGSAAVFTRAFNAHFGVTPTDWRRGAYRSWAERHRIELGKIHQADRKAHQAVAEAFRHDERSWPKGPVSRSGDSEMKIELKTLPEVRVAYMRHVGPYGDSGITRTWQRFAAWCGEHGLMEPRRTMYGVSHDNPDVTPPAKCRYDACVEVGEGFRPEGEIGVQTVGGGRYACTEFTGPSTEIHTAWMNLCDWLPDSGYQPADGAPIEIYGRDFEMDEKTGAFNCTLCMPVRPL
ncbi:transcriptional regulator, AraC family [Variovorax sp. CF079]|uniref:AraC family transcriptional regulator n=1 Tax=Variovorax sp. CF079 TaxID=1882774 RepID=UPI0008811955|nr:AraC family transcriptional regulator [Variovorax sp. CF079]SDC08522.1 transcriptional regulator, AraC family [Variovorax sp. CF079]